MGNAHGLGDGTGADGPDAKDVWHRPSLDLLRSSDPHRVDVADLHQTARRLEDLLAAFNIRGEVSAVRPGPAITVYEVALPSGVRAAAIIALTDDMARGMGTAWAAARSIPAHGVVGIELPNARRQGVSLRELFHSRRFADGDAHLPLALGKDVAGEVVVTDLASMPHLLVAGTTGSGKSVGLNCMVLSMLYRLTPDQCRLILVDPKMLELGIYEGGPHLLAPVLTDPAQTVRALQWAVEQMEDRYRRMSTVGVRSLAGFNDKVRGARARGEPLGSRMQTGNQPNASHPLREEGELDYQVLPRIVVVVDELADVLDALDDAAVLTACLHSIAERGAVAGLHMILSSNRWTAGHLDELVGVVAAGRITYPLAEGGDVEAFLGHDLAARLARPGDMFFMPPGREVVRIHGPFVDEDEIRLVADHWRTQRVSDTIDVSSGGPDALDDRMGAASGEDSPQAQQYRHAVHLVCEMGNASTSWLQRQMRIGYGSAARLIERMEEDGIIGHPDHLGRREVLRDAAGRPVARARTSGARPRGWLSRILG